MRNNGPANEYELFLLRILSGKHPLTGDALPDQSPWSEPEVVSAVSAVLGIEQNTQKPDQTSIEAVKENQPKSNDRLERIRNKHPNAYKPWTKEEEERLASLWESEVELPEIAKSMGRGKGGIKSRLEKMGYEIEPEEDIEVVSLEDESISAQDTSVTLETDAKEELQKDRASWLPWKRK